MRQAQEGITTRQGKPLLDERGRPITLTPAETLAQSISFRPQRIAEISQERRVEANIEEAFGKRRQEVYTRVRQAKNSEDWTDISRLVQKFNLDVMKYRGAIAPISMKSIRQAMQPETGYMKFQNVME
jgi:hypothetical protein